jgi:hypothetical protein
MATFTKINCTISYHCHTIICGNKCTFTSLWKVPFTKNAGYQATSPTATYNHATLTATPTAVLAANVDASSSATKYARYIHQIMCSPPSTILWTLDHSKELAPIPGLTPMLIKNHLP